MNKRLWAGFCYSMAVFLTASCHASEISRARALRIVSAAVQPAMAKNRIPGVAVGLVFQDRSYVFNYGIASIEGQRPVTDATIFEIGSVSKTFTATLASLAAAGGTLRLADPVSRYLPELADTAFGNLQLYHLGTHTTGGLPLQVPDDIRSKDQLLNYLRTWKPPHETGTVRTYANPSIGILGVIAAKSLGQDFNIAMSNGIFQPLSLANTYLSVPSNKLPDYAYGYTKDNAAVRVNPGMLSDEAYGIKTTAADLNRFVKANMGMLQLDSALQTALTDTRKGYFKAGNMTQDLIWEEYPLPVDLQTLQKGNSSMMVFNPIPVVAHVPPRSPSPNAWINKTGSTNGFGAYIAFVPSKRFGIVVLANKNYPNEERVQIAYGIFQALSR